MSADNYYLIRKDGSGYAVECRFASSDYGPNEPISKGAARFPTLPEAQEYAYGEYSEYGVDYDFPVIVHEAPPVPAEALPGDDSEGAVIANAQGQAGIPPSTVSSTEEHDA
jgi:hypothetical protein